MHEQEQILEDHAALRKMVAKRMANPVIDRRQKIPVGTEVYIRPIFENHSVHFNCDIISTVEGTHAQLYGGDDFTNYSLDVGAWYHEFVLMPTNGMTVEECRDRCEEYFGTSYESMKQARKETFRHEFMQIPDDIREEIEQLRNALRNKIIGALRS